MENRIMKCNKMNGYKYIQYISDSNKNIMIEDITNEIVTNIYHRNLEFE